MNSFTRPPATRTSKYNNEKLFNQKRINSDFIENIEKLYEALNLSEENQNNTSLTYNGLFSLLTSLIDFYLHQIAMWVNLPLLRRDLPKTNIIFSSKVKDIKVSFEDYLRLYSNPSQNKEKFCRDQLDSVLYRDTLQGDYGMKSFSQWLGLDIEYDKNNYQSIYFFKNHSASDKEKSYLACINKYAKNLSELRDLRNPGAHQFYTDRKTMRQKVFSKEEIKGWLDFAKEFQKELHNCILELFNDDGTRK